MKAPTSIAPSSALLTLALLAWPGDAFASQAITVFEAHVHSMPDLASPFIYADAKNTLVSVSAEAVRGFRKVRLPDGKSLFR